MNQFTETSSESWFGRIINSIKGVAFGFLLIAGSVFLLSYNENRAVKTARSLKESAGVVIDVAADAVNAANDKKLVHVTGEATVKNPPTDSLFAISESALRIRRKVEMYRWEESRHSQTNKKLGGGTETVTTYSYDKKWSEEAIHSSSFKQPEGHTNPAGMTAKSDTFYAPNATLGAFKLPLSLIAKMKGDVALSLGETHLAGLPTSLKEKAKLSEGGFYFGKDSVTPEIGDQRVSFTVLKPGPFSVIASQTGETFEPYLAKAGGEIERVESGAVSAALMLSHAETENKNLTWLLRLAGFVLMAIGISLIISPIVVFADVIPFLGNVLGAGVFIAAVLLAFAGSLLTIAVAWFVVRPLLSVVLIAAAIALFVFGRRIGGKRIEAAKAA